MAECRLQCPARLVFDVFASADSAKIMEPSIKDIFELERLDAHTSVSHVVMKSIMFTSPRECVLVRHWRALEENGTILEVQFSVEHASVPDGSGGRVRALQTVGGSVIVPEGDS